MDGFFFWVCEALYTTVTSISLVWFLLERVIERARERSFGLGFAKVLGGGGIIFLSCSLKLLIV